MFFHVFFVFPFFSVFCCLIAFHFIFLVCFFCLRFFSFFKGSLDSGRPKERHWQKKMKRNRSKKKGKHKMKRNASKRDAVVSVGRDTDQPKFSSL